MDRPPEKRMKVYASAASSTSPVPPSCTSIHSPATRNITRNSAEPTAASTSTCQMSASARARSPAPRVRAIADATAPPKAPPAMPFTSMRAGKTSAIDASAWVPRRPMNQTSARLTIDCSRKAIAFGVARRTSKGAGGAVRSVRVRSSMRRSILASGRAASVGGASDADKC